MKKYISYWLVIITLLGVNGTLGYIIYDKVIGKESKFLASPAAVAPSYVPLPTVSASNTQSPTVPANTAASSTPKPSDKPVVTSTPKPSEHEVNFNGQIFYRIFDDKGRKEFNGNKVLKEKPESAPSDFSWYWIAAAGTDITVKDSTGKMIGLFEADENGKFSFKVKKDDFYEIELLFMNKERTVQIKTEDSKDLYIGYGIYSTSKRYFTSGGYFGGSELMEK